MRCFNCGKEATDKHHVIFKSQGGSNNIENLVYLCRECHSLIHFGTDAEAKRILLNKLYNKIRPNINKCWKGKIKPKIVNLIEGGFL